MSGLVSPVSRRPLREEWPGILTDGHERWPVLDGIPYLRTGRDELVARLLAALARGEPEEALVLALADQDDWWDGPAPDPSDLRRLVRGAQTLTLREAMALLAFGRVGDYFAHRWSDPTYLAGLALLDAHWGGPARAFELACGIGHYLRDLARCGVEVAGGDVVFAKLWLACHWIVPGADLVCFDAGSPWPVVDACHDLCLCHDAFYFLPGKDEVARRLRGLLRPGGALAIGHVHNREAANLSGGAGVTVGELAAMFPDATVYDDAELTRAGAGRRAPVPSPTADLGRVEAFSLAEGGAAMSRPADGPLCRPAPAAALRPNPLYRPGQDSAEIAWPSERYRAEYAPRATYRLRVDGPLRPTGDAVARREYLDLPERW